MAVELGCGVKKVRWWCDRYGITVAKRSGPRAGSKPPKCSCGESDPAAFRNRYSTCNRCRARLYRLRYRAKRKAAIDFVGGKCSRCGYNRCPAALHFHHRDPRQKAPDWKLLKAKSLDKILNEIRKCDLLCANCHAEEHWDEEVGLAS